MKRIACCIILLCSYYSFSQVGIGTTDPDPSSILEVESSSTGILIPRMSTLDRNSITLPEVSLMIYNTDNNRYEYNVGTKLAPIWNAISYNASIKYSNTDTTTNINVVTAIDAPIFGTLIWNDDTLLYTVSGNTVIIANPGRYRITTNIFYSAPNLPSSNNERRISVLAQLALNNVTTGTIAATGYIRHDDNHDEASLNFTETLDIITLNTSLSLKVFRGGNTADAFLDSSGTSNILIEKLN